MTPLDALAAAVRDRLLAGATAPLPGLGTLTRAHVSARVRVGPDGARVLLPPGEAVGLAARTDDPSEIARAIARHSSAPDEAGAGMLRDAVDQLEARLAITGEARLDGVGVFQRTSSGIRFGAVSDLLAAVNQRYDGLPPIPIASGAPVAPVEAPAPVAASVPPRPAAPPPADEPPGAVDILLDLIVNEPTEPELTEPATPEPATPEPATPEPATPEPSEPAEPPPAEPPRAEPAPSESAFLDDPLETDPVLAVPFGSGDVTLRDVLPPTPPERDPGLEATPQAAPDEPAQAPRGATPPTDDDRSVFPFPDTTPERATAETPVAEAAIIGEPLAEALQEAPIRAVPDGPALADIPDAQLDPAPAPAVRRRSHLAGWLLYGAVVLALAALLLWWTVEERRADPPAPTLTALALPL